MYRIIHSNMGVQDIILVNNRENYFLIKKKKKNLYVYEKKSKPGRPMHGWVEIVSKLTILIKTWSDLSL